MACRDMSWYTILAAHPQAKFPWRASNFGASGDSVYRPARSAPITGLARRPSSTSEHER